jgi:hypothetical protein
LCGLFRVRSRELGASVSQRILERQKKVLFSRVERSLEFLTQVVCRFAGIAWREFGWGALASGFGETLLHPVDTLKTRIQSGKTGLSLQVELIFPFLGGSRTMLLL